MTDQANAPRAESRHTTKDILARLYREIGISAVAAALEVTAPKAEAKNRTHAEASGAPAPKKGLAA